MAANLNFLLTANDKATPVVRKLSSTIKILGGVAGITTSVILGRKLFGAFKSMVQVGIEFEAQMARVTSVLGDVAIRGTKGFTALRQAAIDLGASTVYTAREVAEAQLNFARAGFEVDEILSALNPTLSLAAAGNLSIADSASIAATALRSFAKEGEGAKESAKRLSDGIDIIVKASTESNQTVKDFGEALAYAAPAARVAGADIMDLGIAFGILANRGLKSSIAGTGVRKAFATMLQSAGELEGGISSVNKEMQSTIESGTGLSRAVATQMFTVADDGSKKFVGWAKAVEIMKAAGYSAGDMFQVFGVRAGNAMAILTDLGGPAILDYQNKLKDFEGVAEEVRERAIDSLGGDLIILKSAWESLSIAITDKGTPGMRAFTQALTELITQMRESDDAMSSFDTVFRSIINSVIYGSAAILSLVTVVGKLAGYIVGAIQSIRGAYQYLVLGFQLGGILILKTLSFILHGLTDLLEMLGLTVNGDFLSTVDKNIASLGKGIKLIVEKQNGLFKSGDEWRAWGDDIVEFATDAAGKLLALGSVADSFFKQSLSNRPKTPESEKAAELKKLKEELGDLGVDLKYLGQQYQDWEELLLSNGVYIAGESLGRLALKIENVVAVAAKAGPKMKTLGFALLKKQIDELVKGYQRAGVEVPSLFLKWQKQAREAEAVLVLNTENAEIAIERINPLLKDLGITEVEGTEELQQDLDNLANRYALLQAQLSVGLITQVTFDDRTEEFRKKYAELIHELGEAAVIPVTLDFGDSLVKANAMLDKLGVKTAQSLSGVKQRYDDLIDAYATLKEDLETGVIAPIEFETKKSDLAKKLQEVTDASGGAAQIDANIVGPPRGGVDVESTFDIKASPLRAALLLVEALGLEIEGLPDLGESVTTDGVLKDVEELATHFNAVQDIMRSMDAPEVALRVNEDEFFKKIGELYDSLDADGQSALMEILPFFDPAKWSQSTGKLNDLILAAELAQIETKKQAAAIALANTMDHEVALRAQYQSVINEQDMQALIARQEAELASFSGTIEQKAAIEAAHKEAKTQLEQAGAAATEAIDKKEVLSKKEKAIAGTQAVNQAIQGAFGGTKSAAIAAAGVNIALSITKVLADLGPAGPPVAAVIGAMGLEQLAKIKSQKLPGKGAAYGTTVTGYDTGRDTEPYFLRVGETVLTKNDSAALNRMLAGGASSFDTTRLGQAMDLNRQPVQRSGGAGFAFGGSAGGLGRATTRRRTLESLVGSPSPLSPDNPGLADLNAGERATTGDVHLHIDRVLDGADLRSVLEANLDEFGEMIREAGRRGTI